MLKARPSSQRQITQLTAGMTTAALAKNKAPIVRISAETVPAQAFADLVNGARLYELWTRFAFHDIRQRFRRSVLGPFWLTLSMGIFVGTLGLVFSTLFHQDVAKTLPYIATGVIFWGLLTSCINEGTTVFIVGGILYPQCADAAQRPFLPDDGAQCHDLGLQHGDLCRRGGLLRPDARMERRAVHPRLHPVPDQRRVDIAGGRGALHALSRYPAGDRQCDPGHIFRHSDLLVARNTAEPAGLCGVQPVLSPHRDRPGAVAWRGGAAR